MPPLTESRDLETRFYTYEGVVQALDRISLVVDHGSTYGLVGESGCGKSVTVRSMMRIVQSPGKIEGGKVILFFGDQNQRQGVDLLQQSEAYMESLRGDQVSMIFQEPNAALNPIMNIGDQVAESYLFHQTQDLAQAVLARWRRQPANPLHAARGVLRPICAQLARSPKAALPALLRRVPILRQWQRPLKKEALRRSIALIERLGIPNPEEVVRSYPHNLSGGMKQRIVIAIALACRPLLLIADEATSNLDVTIQAQILDLLRTLKETEIASVLLITHDLGVVAETCDRVGVMYAGNLCEIADVDDLFHAPRHPYTRALLDSVPKLVQENRLQSIEGSVPNLVQPPTGCRFHPRCPHAEPICRKTFPAMTAVGDNHSVACYLYSRRARSQPVPAADSNPHPPARQTADG